MLLSLNKYSMRLTMKQCRSVFSSCLLQFALFTILVSCHGNVYPPLEDDSYKLPSRVDKTSDKKVILMRNAFRRAAVVKVISMGQDNLISFPSSVVFADQSPRVKWESYALLNQIVKYMQQFRKIGVNVTAYTSQYKSTKREQALSLARARIIADYLWSQGIDSRLMVSEGAGSDKPITVYKQGGDREPNSRIEITFREAIV